MASKKNCKLDQQASNFGTMALGAAVAGGLISLISKVKRRRYTASQKKK